MIYNSIYIYIYIRFFLSFSFFSFFSFSHFFFVSSGGGDRAPRPPGSVTGFLHWLTGFVSFVFFLLCFFSHFRKSPGSQASYLRHWFRVFSAAAYNSLIQYFLHNVNKVQLRETWRHVFLCITTRVTVSDCLQLVAFTVYLPAPTQRGAAHAALRSAAQRRAPRSCAARSVAQRWFVLLTARKAMRRSCRHPPRNIRQKHAQAAVAISKLRFVASLVCCVNTVTSALRSAQCLLTTFCDDNSVIALRREDVA